MNIWLISEDFSKNKHLANDMAQLQHGTTMLTFSCWEPTISPAANEEVTVDFGHG